MWDRGANNVDRGYWLAWLVNGCTAIRQSPDHPSSPHDSTIHHSFLLDTAKNCAYGTGLHRSMFTGFMSLTMFCFAQNHHGSYARSGKGHWYQSMTLFTIVVCSPTSVASSALPYRRAPPTWLKTTPDDVVEHICKLARKGLTPSQIGVTLRDSHGIPQVRFVTGNKILRILKSNGWCLWCDIVGWYPLMLM